MMGLTREQRALPQPAVLPDGQGAQGSDRPGRRGDRARRCSRSQARRSSSSPATCPIRTARTACARKRSTRALRRRSTSATRVRGLAVSRRVAGVADHRGDVARAAVAGGAAPQDPGDLQAPVAEGLGALPRAGRSRVLAARRGAQQGHGGACSTGSASPSTSRWKRTSSNSERRSMTPDFTTLDALVLVAYLAGTTALGHLGRAQAARREGLLRRRPRDPVVGGACSRSSPARRAR